MRIANKPKDVFKYVDMSGGPDACWPFTGKVNNKGRPYFTLNGKKVLVYRLVYELVHGEGTLKDRIARHTCDNEICCNPAHIVPGDHQMNMNDMKERERHGLPHYTVRAIRKLASVGRTHQEIGDLYGIGRSTVTEIVQRTNYGHVTEKEQSNDEEERVQSDHSNQA